MKKILLVSSHCFDRPFANGICANSIADVFKSRGYEVHKVGMFNDENSKYVLKKNEYAIKFEQKKAKQYQGFRRKFNSALFLLKQCFTSGLDKRKRDSYYQVIKELNQKQRYDCVVTFLFPPEGVDAVTALKSKGSGFSHVIYELDSLTDGINHYDEHWYGRFIKQSKIRWSKKQYRYANMICTMRCHEKHVEEIYYDKYADKFRIVDLPLLSDNTSFSKENKCTESICFLYTGEVALEYRNPSKFIEILQNTRENKNWRIDMFCKGNGMALLNDYSRMDDRLNVNGYIDAKELVKWYKASDILINIGNSVSNSLPSKLVNYISYGKPIVHISLQKNDVSAEYLSSYPYALIIPFDELPEIAAHRFEMFVRDTANERASFDEIVRLYHENTAEHSVNVIEQLF